VAPRPTLDPVVGSPRSNENVDAGPNAESAYQSLDGSEQPQRRDFAGLDRELSGVKVHAPLTLDDAAALFDVVRPFAPAPLIRDVMHDHREIVIRIYDGKTQIYERRLRALKAR
jgi:hypothetical protein